MTEALPITTERHRAASLERARYNVFLLGAEDITIDLLTDLGHRRNVGAAMGGTDAGR